MILVKKSLDDWLNEVDYTYLNSSSYVPSKFSLMFMNFIKLVNGAQGEANKTPPFHLRMLDKAIEPHSHIVNLVFRGAAKTSVFMEYLTLYLAVFGELPGFGDVTGMIYVSDSMENGVKNARKNIETRYNNSDFLQDWLPKATFTDPYLEFESKAGHPLGAKMFGAMTGIRGSKIFAKRPTIAILDDLIGDSDATSKAAMDRINDTVYSGLDYALDPKRKKVIFNGTPFNADDIIVKAVESGGWHANVWPVCESFPCTREEFVGAWEDRFSYDTLLAQYNFAVGTGRVSSFMQELMLRISSFENRLVQDGEIVWESRAKILQNRGDYNFYITTDFATSHKKRADFSVIFVWAYCTAGKWHLIDGICERQTMDKNINKLFEYVREYSPQSVGVEVSGQQRAFIDWLKSEMLVRSLWFTFASSSQDNSPGVRPAVDKLVRFNLVVPWFKSGLIVFPEELKSSAIMARILQQISMTTMDGIKGKDDCIDGISMLGYLKPWKPVLGGTAQAVLEDDDADFRYEVASISNYLV